MIKLLSLDGILDKVSLYEDCNKADDCEPFDLSYYYELGDSSAGARWFEMSYLHETTTWRALEDTEWDVFVASLEGRSHVGILYM